MPLNRKAYSDEDLNWFYQQAGRYPSDADPNVVRSYLLRSNKPPTLKEQSMNLVKTGKATAVDSLNAGIPSSVVYPKPVKPTRPSADIQDSLAVWGSTGQTGKVKSYMDARYPPKPKNPKEYDASTALADSIAARALRGDVEGAQKLKASISAPKTPKSTDITDSVARAAQNNLAKLVTDHGDITKAPIVVQNTYNMNKDIVDTWTTQKTQKTLKDIPMKLQNSFGDSPDGTVKVHSITGTYWQKQGKDWIQVQPQ